MVFVTNAGPAVDAQVRSLLEEATPAERAELTAHLARANDLIGLFFARRRARESALEDDSPTVRARRGAGSVSLPDTIRPPRRPARSFARWQKRQSLRRVTFAAMPYVLALVLAAVAIAAVLVWRSP